MKQLLYIALLVLSTQPLQAGDDLPKDKYFHLTAQMGERFWAGSLRIGYNGLEVGKLNTTAVGFVYRLGVEYLVAGLGLGYGGSGFEPSTGGFYSELGAHYPATHWLDLRIDFSGFISAYRTMHSEFLVGVGIHL